MITTYDIAQKAGVSQATVSFVLNKRDTAVRISEKTRDRVLQAANELGYRRNGSAQALSSGRFNAAALLTSTQAYHSYLPQGLMQGIHDELAVHNMHLTLAMLSDDQLTDGEFVPKILREWLADGLLIDYNQQIPQRLVELVTGHNLPAVWINTKQEADCVFPDDFGAAKRATEHLLTLGHRKIAWVDFSHGTESKCAHYSAHDRFEGYGATMDAAGCKPQDWRGKTGVAEAERVEFSRQILSQPERPTAILAYGYALPLMVAALSLGLQVPQDLSVMLFGDATLNFVGTPISSMTEPNAEVGRLAVRMLREKIAAPKQVLAPQSVPFTLSEGATCAPPRS